MTAVVQPSPFAGELRRWRQRRRWSQLDLANRAGTTQRHLSYIEQGRSQPGRAIVIRLAESLELGLRERNGLLVAAGYAPVYDESPFDDERIRPVRDALERIIVGHLPYPAVVVRPHGELVAANAALDALVDGVDPKLLEPPINVLRVALHPDGMAGRVANLPEWSRHIVENLRARELRSPDPRRRELIDELEGYVPPAPSGPDHIGFAVPLRLATADGELQLLTTLTSFATAVDVTVAELELEAFLPADDETSTVLIAAESRRVAEGRPAVWGRQ
jgi:transcriptional regulator with XRE-family HTH domain